MHETTDLERLSFGTQLEHQHLDHELLHRQGLRLKRPHRPLGEAKELRTFVCGIERAAKNT